MDVFVDDEPIAGTAFSTVEEAVRAVQAECLSDRIIVQLRCDGRDVTGDSMAADLRKRAAAVEKLELFTASKVSLVTDAMTQASASLQRAEQECRTVAELLSQGRTQEGMEAFAECLKVWQQIHQAVTKSLQMLELDADRASIRDVPLAELLLKPKETLLQVRDALAAQDYVMLADVLQYELADVTDQWYALLAMLREEAEKLGAERE